MYSEIWLVYKRFYNWLVRFPYYWWSWHEAVQHKFGNIYTIVPVGGNVVRFPRHHHPFHILGPSPWPFCVALAILALVSGLVDMLSAEAHYVRSLLIGLSELGLCLWLWWRDVIRESLTEHTRAIKHGIAIGMLLFILSEVMFFFSFFWAFFHVSLAPGIELGCVWPPKGLEGLVISPFGAPLLNTLILLASGVTVTCAHYAFLAYCYRQRRLSNFLEVWGTRFTVQGALYVYSLCVIEGKVWWWFKSRHFARTMSTFLWRIFRRIKHTLFHKLLTPIMLDQHFLNCFRYFVFTLILAVFFTFSQGLEYVESPVSISDGVYGSTFFVMTGFHGFHVLVGTLFLAVCLGRIMRHRYSFVHFIGLECAIWYWHFVDVVWLFLFIFVYLWGNALVPVIDYTQFGGAEADFAHPYQLDFQDSASVMMEGIVDLHNYIMFYLWVILGLVTWMLVSFVLTYFSPKLVALPLYLRLMGRDVYVREFVSRRLYYLVDHEYEATRWKIFDIRDRDFLASWGMTLPQYARYLMLHARFGARRVKLWTAILLRRKMQKKKDHNFPLSRGPMPKGWWTSERNWSSPTYRTRAYWAFWVRRSTARR